MGRFLQTKLTLAAMLLSFVFTPASAYDFEVDGLYYNVISLEELTCEITYGDNKYTGEIVIPSNVSYNGQTLSVTAIGSEAFSGCIGLTKFVVPGSVISIGNGAFQGCEGITKLVIEDDNTTLKLGYNKEEFDGLFSDCPIDTLYVGRNFTSSTGNDPTFGHFGLDWHYMNVVIGNLVTEISPGAFAFCCFNGLTMGDSVTKIGSHAFCNARGLEGLYIGNPIIEIGSMAFVGTDIRSVVIGNSVVSIEYCAFSGLQFLESVTSLNPLPPILGGYNFIDAKEPVTLYVPQESISAYQAAEYWKDIEDIQGIDITEIKNTKISPIIKSSSIFDLQGRSFSAPRKGINIINGKKVLVRD